MPALEIAAALRHREATGSGRGDREPLQPREFDPAAGARVSSRGRTTLREISHMNRFRLLALLLAGSALAPALFAAAESAAPAPAAAEVAAPPTYDEALATSVGADEHGMRKYVLVILKTGPTRVPDGPERQEMFRGHFANMNRLAEEGKLAVAGPLDGVDGWRGLFILSVPTIEEAKPLVATDPVIQKGEMVAEYHAYFGSAALMKVNELHAKIQKKSF
jgi:uncharacterized protein YciI